MRQPDRLHLTQPEKLRIEVDMNRQVTSQTAKAVGYFASSLGKPVTNYVEAFWKVEADYACEIAS